MPQMVDRLALYRHHQNMQIYKILLAHEWCALETNGETDGTPIDLADGFIHFSTAAQVPETAANHFAGEDGLLLLALSTETLASKLKWEPSRGGALFPHLYRRLQLDDILWCKPLSLVDGQHQFPADML